MEGFIPELLKTITEQGQIAVLMLDQSQVNKDFDCLMVSLPVAWKVKKTKGEIGYSEQEALLRIVYNMIPKGIKILLAADRFYGTAALILLCKKLGWSYRIKLKRNLKLTHQDGWELNANEAKNMGLCELEHVKLGEKGPELNVGILHEPGHPEVWFIAMDTKPSLYRTLDYSLRWGIEALFSDLKTRGFSITKTQLRHGDRIERLLLILAIALYWAISTGMKPKENLVNSKKTPKVINIIF